MKSNRFLLTAAALAPVVWLFMGGTARAIKQFETEFKSKYVNLDTTNPQEEAWAATVATAKCNVCHVGKKRKDRNAYGTALAALLDRKKDKKDKDKIRAALDSVAAMKIDPQDEGSPTFGELIGQHRLPGNQPPGQSP